MKVRQSEKTTNVNEVQKNWVHPGSPEEAARFFEKIQLEAVAEVIRLSGLTKPEILYLFREQPETLKEFLSLTDFQFDHLKENEINCEYC